MTAQELRDIIQKALAPLGLWSAGAEELLMATAAQESHLGQYRRQINGPALGIYQMEPATFNDLFTNYLQYHPTIKSEILFQSHGDASPETLVENDAFATCMARVLYLRAPEALPASTDLGGIWRLYKLRWNTPLGAATHDQFVANYNRYVKAE